MNLGRLKQLVNKLGGLLVLDDNEPSFVMLSYDKYRQLDSGEEIPLTNGNGLSEQAVASEINDDEETVERLNQEILALKEEIRQREEAELVGNGQPTGTISDGVDLD